MNQKRPASSKLKRSVALTFPLGISFIERLIPGIIAFARQHGGWSFTRMPEMLNTSVEWLRHWRGDGAIAMVTTEEDAAIVKRLPYPVVNLAAWQVHPEIASVTVDHRLIGDYAAKHLLERGFKRFGYYGTEGMWYSEMRGLGFQQRIKEFGGELKKLEASASFIKGGKWRDQHTQLRTWLKTLTPPVGILASTDLRASMVLDVCKDLDLRVPNEVALVGVDNDPLICEFCTPSLSSISRNDFAVGFQAASLLEKLISGPPPSAARILVSPEGVVQRKSTDTLAAENPLVIECIQYIRDHLSEHFGVERLLRETRSSRRTLELRFNEALGRSPYALINELRVERAKHLLLSKERLSLTEIARKCGFSDLRRLRLVFQRVTSTTPAAYQQTEGLRRAKNENP